MLPCARSTACFHPEYTFQRCSNATHGDHGIIDAKLETTYSLVLYCWTATNEDTIATRVDRLYCISIDCKIRLSAFIHHDSTASNSNCVTESFHLETLGYNNAVKPQI